MRSIKLGTGVAYWGDTLRPALEMVQRADIDYLCCDHLAELTMSMLSKQRARNPELGYTPDVIPLLKSILPTAHERGIKIITDAGGANPKACAEAIREVARNAGLRGLTIAVIEGDDIYPRLDAIIAEGAALTNLDDGRPISAVRDLVTQANVYMGSEGVVEALDRGADIVVCGRVTDIALYLGPMMHELGWSADDWPRLGAGTGVAHIIECGGQATGGIYDGGWDTLTDLDRIGYPVAEVFEDGTAIVSKTPGSGGEVSVGTVSEQLVYEIHDPAAYLTADVVCDLSGVTLEQVGPDQVRVTGITGHPHPDQLKVNMGYRDGFVGETTFTYTWPKAYSKARAGIKFVESRLAMAGVTPNRTRVEFLGKNSMWGELVENPASDDDLEVVVRYAAHCDTREQARTIFRESVPIFNNGPAGGSGIGTSTAVKELYGAWPALVDRDLVKAEVTMVEV